MSAPNLAATRKIGPFLLGRKLGAGGMATVFAAREETPHVRRLVALKVLSPHLSHDDAEHRAFMREAAIATRLEHPNIVRIYDVGQIDGTMYLAMELVHGTSVSALVKAASGPVPMPIMLRLASDVAAALHEAHELADPNHGALGVVHQDVSPQNVLVSYEGAVKLVDFGVARLGSLEGSRTETLRGKPSYASPEQIAGKNIDRRTDVFALGIITWELLTGERLFRRDTNAATYLAVIQGPIPYARDKNREVPAVIADQVAKALERNRESRFESAEAFRKALVDAAKQVDIAAASKEELADWVKKMVPPTFAKEELDREIGPKIVEAVVPDLDLPFADPTANMPTKPVPKPATPNGATPEVRVPSSPALPPVDVRPGSSPEVRRAAPEIRRSSPEVRRSSPSMPGSGRMQAPDLSSSGDDFEMEIERDVAGSAMARAMAHSSTGMHAAQATPPPQRIAPTATGLELAAQRSYSRTQQEHEEPGTGTKIAAVAVPILLVAGTIVGLAKATHKEGLDPLQMMPHAFDGTSVAHSGGVAIGSLVLALALGALGLKAHPRSWSLVCSGSATLIAALAMVTVTLASSGENPTPPDGALLVPYLVPFVLATLAAGVAGRSRRLLLDDRVSKKALAIPIAAVAGVIAFAAVAATRLVSMLP